MSTVSLNSDARPASSPSITHDSRNLDLLRAVAVLCVFFVHLILCLLDAGDLHGGPNQALIYRLLELLGHFGVLSFFVHTALVLMISLDRMAPQRLVWNFYIRRIFRIYPLSIACIATILLFHVPQQTPLQYANWGWDVIAANLLLVQNIVHKPDLIGPLWSLPAEVQMYCVLPFLYLLLKRFSSSIVVLALWFAFFAAAPYTPLLAWAPCFMGGVLAYQLSKEKTFGLPSFVWPASVAVLFVLFALCYMMILPDFRSDCLLCMFLGAVVPNVVDLRKSSAAAVCHTIAKYSYGIYLFHNPVLWFSFVKLAPMPAAVQWSAMVVLMIAVPLAGYKLIESPFIGLGRRLGARWTAAASTRLESPSQGVGILNPTD